MTRIAHISDIHFGRIAHPGIVQALIRDINASNVDIVVVSGDLTQRAFPNQFRAARRMLDAFDAPTLTVPGNHDVYPWWRIFSRLIDPLRRFRRYIEADMAPRRELSGVVIQGINSAFGWTIQGGKITTTELDQVRAGFETAPEGAARILVVHHHLTELKELPDHDLSRGAHAAFSVAHEMGVDIILCGHLHVSHVAHITRHKGAKPIIVATSGTSTSSRSRGAHKANYYNIIAITRSEIALEERLFEEESDLFIVKRGHSFSRN